MLCSYKRASRLWGYAILKKKKVFIHLEIVIKCDWEYGVERGWQLLEIIEKNDRLWKFHLKLKVLVGGCYKLFFLYTKDRLRTRGIDLNEYDDIYGGELEDRNHSLFYYMRVKEMWDFLFVGLWNPMLSFTLRIFCFIHFPS